MAHRRGAVEEIYEPEHEREGLWDKVKSWFGPDDPDMEGEHHDMESHGAARRPHTGTGFFPLNNNHRQMRVSVRLSATTMEDAQEAADSLKDRCQVILNLEHADDGMDRRILDFVSGACYALDGFYQRVGNKVFLFAPSNVYIEVEDDTPAGTVRPPAFLSQQV